MANKTVDADVYVSYAERQILATIVITISFLGVTGNLLVIAAVILTKKLHHTTNMFVLNLSITDLLTNIFIPFGAVAVLSEVEFPLPMILCSLTAFIFYACFGCSINNLMCIAINRYVMIIHKRATYQRLFSPKRTVVAILLTWLIPMCFLIIPVATGFIKLGFEPEYSSCSWVKAESQPGFHLILFAAFCPLQLATIFFCYIRIFYHISSHAKKVRHLDRAPSISEITSNVPEPPANRKNKLQAEVTKNLFTVVCTFFLCVAPYSFSLILPKTEQFIPIAGVILTGNSCVNPLIYAAKHPHFRTVFRCIITMKCTEIPERSSFKCFC
ncbi:melatonin receptor type 1A-like [Asterias amurensis]|uniref:melatonin receptor type 1A-like n=1 Tax=Asterias amurensis TaxID=7602 RepID=UPI003AB8DFAD